MNKRLVFVSALYALVVSGCGTVWVKPGATEQEFYATKGHCTARAQAEFPYIPEQTQIGSGYTTPIVTNCNGFGYSYRCYTTGGNYVPPMVIIIDINASRRNSDIESCFYENGWTPEK
ncbi:MAG: hypothetical protein ACREAU_03590 [Nitrosopumilaceae archaeon]